MKAVFQAKCDGRRNVKRVDFKSDREHVMSTPLCFAASDKATAAVSVLSKLLCATPFFFAGYLELWQM